jgi:WD40 repeat protein
VLTPLQPPGSLAATLATRLSGDRSTTTITDQLLAGLTGPYLRAIAPLPDLPHPALSRVLTGHTGAVSALVVAPDGSWLASADGQVRVWDPTTATPFTSLRVAGRLFHLALASTTIVAAGEYGPYFLALCRGIQPGQDA